MATPRQVEANRKNAARSTGPRSAEGKSRSRANATKHGLAGESADVEAGLCREFEGRRASWAAELHPVGEPAGWALDRAVAASFRIERCEQATDELVATTRRRAELAWEEDRAVEAAGLAARLDRDPVLASRQLQVTLAGAVLLIEAWLALVEVLEPGRDWSELECSRALDLLGVDPDFRTGRTPIDAPDGADPIASRRSLALDEIDRLETLCDEALAPLDAMERRQAMKGDVALLSKPAKLLLRYEREAWKRHRESMKVVQATAPPPVQVAPAPIVTQPPKPRERPVAPTPSSSEPERRDLLAEASSDRWEAADQLAPMGSVEEDDWFDAFERRIGGTSPLPGAFVPIAVGARAPGG